MPSRGDPIGKLLLRAGVIAETSISDVLEHQRHTLPFASTCYVLGLAGEDDLARALSKQCGVPGISLERCVIRLSVLDDVPRELALLHNVLPVFEDERRLFVAAEDPVAANEVLRELEMVRGRTVLPHIALHVTLARTIRACYAARARNESFYVGAHAEPDDASDLGTIVAVSDVDSIPHDAPVAAAQEAVIEDVTKEIFDADLVLMDATDTGVDEEPSTTDNLQTPVMAQQAVGSGVSTDPAQSTTRGLTADTPLSEVELIPDGAEEMIDLDEGDGAPYEPSTASPPRILIIDDDFATRHLLVKELQPLSFVTVTASNGGEGVRLIKSSPPNLIVVDVMLPEINGFQICRAVKQSSRYHEIPVILMSAVIDSGRVTDEVLRRHGADAYFEKPLNTERIKRRIKDLLGGEADRRRAAAEESFERALDLYRRGEIDEAVEALREGLRTDPMSAKHHFVLANLLQKQSLIYEAIDEYEATVDLKPDYFPALTRLAYLYYKKGFSAKAIEAWRRSLPHCPDANLRQNIEVFMRKLIADMQSEA